MPSEYEIQRFLQFAGFPSIQDFIDAVDYIHKATGNRPNVFITAIVNSQDNIEIFGIKFVMGLCLGFSLDASAAKKNSKQIERTASKYVDAVINRIQKGGSNG